MRIETTNQLGFSMIEILVTMIVIATALFGTAGMQIYAMTISKSSEFRTQAVLLASDISERMEANKAGMIASNYKMAATKVASTSTSDCLNSSCTPAMLASWDLSQWSTAASNILPQPTLAVAVSSVVNTIPASYEIKISWVERSTDKTKRTEPFTYTAIRTVRN